MGHMCKKCGIMSTILLLLIGIGFLLVDLGTWTFWGLNWWTVGILYVAFTKFAMGGCKDCCKVEVKKK